MQCQRRLASRVKHIGNVLEQSGVALRLAPPYGGLLVCRIQLIVIHIGLPMYPNGVTTEQAQGLLPRQPRQQNVGFDQTTESPIRKRYLLHIRA